MYATKKIYPIEASEWLDYEEEERQLMKLTKGYAVINNRFFPYFRARDSIRLFYGGYGSGKSVFIAQDLIAKCLEDPYFKCYYGRKVFADVHHSCFETIIETIEDMGLSAFFKFSQADNSTMVIRCTLNGNMFIPFGCDRPERLKSIKDPTHIWCEEFDQFEDGEGEKPGDFQILYPRLRTLKAKTEFIASFNTAQVYEHHWIMKYFFPEMYRGKDGSSVVTPSGSRGALLANETPFHNEHGSTAAHHDIPCQPERQSKAIVEETKSSSTNHGSTAPAEVAGQAAHHDMDDGTPHPDTSFYCTKYHPEVSKCFANYTDNHFVDHSVYFRNLQLSAGGNDDLLRAIAHGEWGVTDNKHPWLYAFDAAKHVVDDIPLMQGFEVYLSFDFNNDPFACTAWQMSPDKGSKRGFVHAVREFSGYIKLEEMCERIKAAFPNTILHITGDRSGQNEDIGRNQTLYQMIAANLGISDKQLNLNNTNLAHADSRLLMNTMFHAYPNLYIHRRLCPNLVHQCSLAKVDAKQDKPSQLLKDRGLYKMDEFDSMRYFFQTYFHEYARRKYYAV